MRIIQDSDSPYQGFVPEKIAGLIITIDVPPPSTAWQRLLTRWNLRPRQVKYTLGPLVGGNVQGILRVFNQLPDEIKTDDVELALKHLSWEHLDDIIYIVAVGLQNNREEPSKRLIQLIQDNLDSGDFSTTDLMNLFYLVLRQLRMAVRNFGEALILIKGRSILDNSHTTLPEEVPAGETKNLSLLNI